MYSTEEILHATVAPPPHLKICSLVTKEGSGSSFVHCIFTANMPIGQPATDSYHTTRLGALEAIDLILPMHIESVSMAMCASPCSKEMHNSHISAAEFHVPNQNVWQGKGSLPGSLSPGQTACTHHTRGPG